jgi:ribose transport system permease protein
VPLTDGDENQTSVLGFAKSHGTLLCFAAMVAAFAILLPDTFLTARNLFNISQQVSMLAVVAFAMTIVMAMGDFDLSVGSMASLSGVVAAVTFRDTGSVTLGITLALLTGVAGGALNGALVSYLGILPFVATLGTLTIFSGLAFITASGKTIFGADVPESFGAFAKASVVGVPTLTLLALLTLLVVWFVLQKLAFGRHLYAMGGSTEAARLAGVAVNRVRLSAYVISGIGAAVAGLMYASRVASANPTQGSGLMLDGIAAVFLGMTMTAHGEPRVLHTLLGVAILGILSNGLTQLSVDSYVRNVLVGTIIIVAVAVSSMVRLRRN